MMVIIALFELTSLGQSKLLSKYARSFLEYITKYPNSKKSKRFQVEPITPFRFSLDPDL